MPSNNPLPSLEDASTAYLDWMALQNYSPLSVRERRRILGYFTTWCGASGITGLARIDRVLVEGWQTHLHRYRKKHGQPLCIAVQHNRLVQLQAFFRWLFRKGHIPSNPAADLELPKRLARLPLQVLSPTEIESVLKVPDVASPVGLRDRALMELLWSTGIRRREAANLSLASVDWERGVVKVYLGKGGRDRVVPVGQRALDWLRRYLDAAHASMNPGSCHRLFVTSSGRPFSTNGLGNLVHDHLVKAGHPTAGGCHAFRHAMATAMLDHGADIRFVQEMLGHQRLETTLIYTHVSIGKLKSVHRSTHPAERSWAEQSARTKTFATEITAKDIAAVRRQLDMDRAAFARLLGVSTASLARLESGRSTVRGSVLRLLQLLHREPALAKALHDSLQDPPKAV